jgi:hypothetical protein
MLLNLFTFLILSFSHPRVNAPSRVLSARAFSLEDRYGVKSVNDVFRDNILLTLAYTRGAVSEKTTMDDVRKPFAFDLTLPKGAVFAFHDDIDPRFDGKQVQTTHAHFNAAERFETDGYLFGDGVCHLASLIYWAAKDAGLETLVPTNHDFMPIPDVPKEFGVAILAIPGAHSANQAQNLYITNNLAKDVTIHFSYDSRVLKVTITEA